MQLKREHLTEYLIYLLSITLFLGKAYQIVAGLVVVSFFLDVIRTKQWIILKDRLFLILSFWCLYLFTSALWSANPPSTMIGALELFLWCCLYLSIRYTFTSKVQIEQFIKLQALILLFVALNALIQFFLGYNLFGIPLTESRVTDLLQGRRTTGHLLPIWIGLLGAMLAFSGHPKRIYLLYSIALIGLLITLPLTGTRGPLVILAIFLPIIAWVSPYRKWAFISLSGLLMFILIIVAITPTLQQRLSTLSNPLEDQKHLRIPIWLTAFEEFKDNPFLGVGFKNFRERQFDYYEESFESFEINPKTGKGQLHAHSPWMDILSEQGTIGVAFALSLLGTIALMAYRSGINVWIGSMGVWYAFSLLNSTFVLSSGRWSFFMILSISFFGLIYNYQKTQKQSN